jgi:hypothetical protein
MALARILVSQSIKRKVALSSRVLSCNRVSGFSGDTLC